MKRILTLLAAAAVLLGCSEDRSQILKVYNWSDYIDEAVIPEFEQWYEEQTGEKVHVIYQTFDINETMLSKIEKGHEDYDVVCPSDYIIERMLQNDLLLPIDRDFGQTPNYIDENLSPYIRECFNKIQGGGKNANDYSVGYMWGTTGILYNAKYVTEEEAATWEVIRNPKFFDVLVTENTFGDILTDEASVISGSMGLLASASVGEHTSLFEPIHGSYPQAAGKNIANPLAAILSAAMMFEYAFGLMEEGRAIRTAVAASIDQGVVTEDLADGGKAFSTTEVGDWIANHI